MALSDDYRPRQARAGSGLRRLVLGAVVLLVVAGGVAYWRSASLLEAGREAFRAGRWADAEAAFQSASAWRVRRTASLDGLGITALGRGDLAEGAGLLEQASAAWWSSRALEPQEVLARFFADGDNAAVVAYSDYALGFSEDPDVWIGAAAASLAVGELDRARELLDRIDSGREPPPLAQDLRRRLRQTEADGTQFFLLDREGRALAGRRTADGETVIVHQGLSRLLEGPSGLLAALDTRARTNRIHLGLDLDLQRAAAAALGRHSGAVIALDPRTGEIRAAADSVADGRPSGEGEGEVGFRAVYEPGSILKVLTMAAYLQAGQDGEPIVPLECSGNQLLDGILFYDWTTHHHVEDLPEALAVSCNVAFGRMGLRLGRDALDAELVRAGFGGRLPADEVPMAMGGFLPFDESHPDYALARRAVGLDSLTITPIHAALIAAALAGDGRAMRPRLVAERVNALGEVYRELQPEALFDLELDAAVLDEVRRGMVRVVEDPRGTGRRAALEGLEMGLKTGTSGKRDQGLDALIIGFAPAGEPVLAFALVLEGAGKAEIAGARAAHALLSAYQASSR